MKIFLTVSISLILAASTCAQDTSRELKYQRIKELNEQASKIAQELFQPDLSDSKEAASKELSVFRLMPRELVARVIVTPREGGSFYSFTKRSNEYGNVSQIGLEGNDLKSGFAGADYGFITDLGNIEVSEIGPNVPEVDSLLKYKAPTNIVDARAEYKKFSGLRSEGQLLSVRSIPAIVGHSYILRSIKFNEADVLIALKIVRKDSDGSLIIQWIQVADFGKPMLDPNIKEN